MLSSFTHAPEKALIVNWNSPGVINKNCIHYFSSYKEALAALPEVVRLTDLPEANWDILVPIGSYRSVRSYELHQLKILPGPAIEESSDE